MNRTSTSRTASVILFTLVFSATAIASAVGPAMSAKAAGGPAGAAPVVSAPLA